MSAKVLYLGDTSLTGAAAYLAGVMAHFGRSFDYVVSDQRFSEQTLAPHHSLYILSDYPAAMMSAAAQERIVSAVAEGAGLLMIGGWESYHGLGGDWDSAPLAAALPVQISSKDDRVNCDQPALIVPANDAASHHPITAGLPWDQRSPTIGGFNAFTARADTQVLLEVERYTAQRKNQQTQFQPRDRHPLLVVGRHQRGRTAALATDAAPHWVGGFVDWGDGRVQAQAPASNAVEVGNLYADFFNQLLAWLTPSV